MWMNLYELKQPLQSKEPTHFITAPAHQALAVPHTSLSFGLWRKKIIVPFSGPQNTRWVSSVQGAYTLREKGVQTGAGILHPLGEPARETQKDDPRCPPGVHTSLCFWLLLTVFPSNFHLLLRGRRISLNIYGINDFLRPLVFSTQDFTKGPGRGLENEPQKHEGLRTT